jgi:hypothetical protein
MAMHLRALAIAEHRGRTGAPSLKKSRERFRGRSKRRLVSQIAYVLDAQLEEVQVGPLGQPLHSGASCCLYWFGDSPQISRIQVRQFFCICRRFNLTIPRRARYKLSLWIVFLMVVNMFFVCLSMYIPWRIFLYFASFILPVEPEKGRLPSRALVPL